MTMDSAIAKIFIIVGSLAISSQAFSTPIVFSYKFDNSKINRGIPTFDDDGNVDFSFPATWDDSLLIDSDFGGRISFTIDSNSPLMLDGESTGHGYRNDGNGHSSLSTSTRRAGSPPKPHEPLNINSLWSDLHAYTGAETLETSEWGGISINIGLKIFDNYFPSEYSRSLDVDIVQNGYFEGVTDTLPDGTEIWKSVNYSISHAIGFYFMDLDSDLLSLPEYSMDLLFSDLNTKVPIYSSFSSIYREVSFTKHILNGEIISEEKVGKSEQLIAKVYRVNSPSIFAILLSGFGFLVFRRHRSSPQ
jgi:hypothetical protein